MAEDSMSTVHKVASLALRHALNGDLLHKAYYLPQVPIAVAGVLTTLAITDRVLPEAQLRNIYLDALEQSAQNGQRTGIRVLLRNPRKYMDLITTQLNEGGSPEDAA